MKMVFLMTIASCLSIASTAFAETAEEAQQKEFTYSFVCSSNEDLTFEQNQLFFTNQDAQRTRVQFQGFVSNPKQLFGSITTQFEQMAAKIKADLYAQYAEQIKTLAAQIAVDKNISVEQAEKELVDNEVAAAIMQQAGTDAKGAIASTAISNCGLLSYVADKIASNGCKVAETGAAIDVTKVTQFCSSIETQSLALGLSQEKIQAIQKELQDKIAALQQEAQANATPYVDSVDKINGEIYDLVQGLIGEETTTEVPLATP